MTKFYFKVHMFPTYLSYSRHELEAGSFQGWFFQKLVLAEAFLRIASAFSVSSSKDNDLRNREMKQP